MLPSCGGIKLCISHRVTPVLETNYTVQQISARKTPISHSRHYLASITESAALQISNASQKMLDEEQTLRYVAFVIRDIRANSRERRRRQRRQGRKRKEEQRRGMKGGRKGEARRMAERSVRKPG